MLGSVKVPWEPVEVEADCRCVWEICASPSPLCHCGSDSMQLALHESPTKNGAGKGGERLSLERTQAFRAFCDSSSHSWLEEVIYGAVTTLTST